LPSRPRSLPFARRRSELEDRELAETVLEDELDPEQAVAMRTAAAAAIDMTGLIGVSRNGVYFGVRKKTTASCWDRTL
jgi:hypothetical protein